MLIEGGGIAHGFYCHLFSDPLNSFGLRELHVVNYCPFAPGHKLPALKSLCSFQSAGYSPLTCLFGLQNDFLNPTELPVFEVERMPIKIWGSGSPDSSGPTFPRDPSGFASFCLAHFTHPSASWS